VKFRWIGRCETRVGTEAHFSFENIQRRGALKALSSASLLAVTAFPALAQFRVEVSGIGLTQLPIALPVFKGEAQAPQKNQRHCQSRSGTQRHVPLGGHRWPAGRRNHPA
jgi:hypothetical protein